jgi:hypothetical protein
MSESLEILFSSAARVQMLRLFLLNPERSFYQRQIERKTGQPIRAVQREVARLVETDLLSRSTEGNRVFYRVNPEYPLLVELTGLVQKAVAAEGVGQVARVQRSIPPEPSTIPQPFPWMVTPCLPPLPEGLRRMQVGGEWDRAY